MARGKVSPRYTARRKGDDEGGPDGSAWLGTYGDVVTLLMAFFIMLYAISQVDQMKFQAFVDGLSEPFGNQATVGMLEGAATLEEGAGSPMVTGDDGGGLLLVPPLDEGQGPEPETSEEPTDDASDRANDDAGPSDRQLVAAELAEALRVALEQEGLDADVAELRPDERGVVISVASDDVLFALGSARVSRLGQRIIAAVATVVDDLPNEVIVEGHTDDLPLRRRGYDNWNLSTDRAVAVLQLLADGDVSESRLVAAGYGEHRPRVPNDSAAQRSNNRRVDVVLVADQRISHDG